MVGVLVPLPSSVVGGGGAGVVVVVPEARALSLRAAADCARAAKPRELMSLPLRAYGWVRIMYSRYSRASMGGLTVED